MTTNKQLARRLGDLSPQLWSKEQWEFLRMGFDNLLSAWPGDDEASVNARMYLTEMWDSVKALHTDNKRLIAEKHTLEQVALDYQMQRDMIANEMSDLVNAALRIGQQNLINELALTLDLNPEQVRRMVDILLAPDDNDVYVSKFTIQDVYKTLGKLSEEIYEELACQDDPPDQDE
ncbi:MAG: hypothetical protein SF029_25990 [bacterium]|nr:hypothetical protein [bacterium]